MRYVYILRHAKLKALYEMYVEDSSVSQRVQMDPLDLGKNSNWKKRGLDFRLSLTRPKHTRATFIQSRQMCHTRGQEHGIFNIEAFVSIRGLRE